MIIYESVCVCVYAGPPKTEKFPSFRNLLVFARVCHTLSLSFFLSRYMRLGADMVALRDVDVLDDQVP